MNKLMHGAIGVRLGAAFAALVFLLLACVAFGVWRLGALNNAMQSLMGHEVRAGVLSAQLDSQAQSMAKALGQAVLTDSVDDIQVQLKRVEKLRSEGTQTRQSLKEALATEGGLAALKAVVEVEPAFAAAIEKIATAIKGGDMDAARQQLNEKSMRLATENYLDALTQLSRNEQQTMERAQLEAGLAYADGRNLLWGAAAVATLLAATLGSWITGTLTAPAREAVTAAQRIAQGDLTTDLSTTRHDEMGQILHSMQDMQVSLRSVVGRVRRNAEHVSTSSAQIAAGNLDLSRRTEQQANALQQSAASMEVLGTTVKQSADNARDANHLAQSASTVAIRGGTVVGQVVETMKGINESSRKIGDIISVIDSIAFQTNILALNAAVEAARAGEQGRGFAVVASEVRNLAGRSADAAREIKLLITASVARVEQGSALVNQAGSTMEEVVNSIRRVTDIMGEISSASAEQSEGVAQVGRAVTQMDQATQQNAALVEESAAAAASLQGQAEQLVQAVGAFKLAAAHH